MNGHGWLQLAVYFGALGILAPLLGRFLAAVFKGAVPQWMRPLKTVEDWTYRLAGCAPGKEMRWTQYAVTLLWFNLAGLLVILGLQLTQQWLPLNPARMPNVPWSLALNTAVSFVTNTNWQAYAGAATLSNLTQMLGLAVLQRLREWSRVPVLILTVREADQEKVAALDAGADDYLTKPFSTAELLARLRVALRHAQPLPENAVFRSGNLEVNLASRQVTVLGKEVKLTPTEYAFLRLLVRNAGRVVTQRQILTEVWGPKAVEQIHYLRVYAAHLREKLDSDPARPELILTEPGIGYRLTATA